MDKNLIYNSSNRLDKNFKPFIKPLQEKKSSVLEIGVCSGGSARWFLNNVLIQPDSTYIGIDPWDTSLEWKKGWSNSSGAEKMKNTEQTALECLKEFPGKVTFHKGRSDVVLFNSDIRKSHVDVVYIDGNHEPVHIIKDFALTWDLVVQNGFIIFDDYRTEKRRYAKVVSTVNNLIDSMNTREECCRIIFSNNGQLGIQKMIREPSKS